MTNVFRFFKEKAAGFFVIALLAGMLFSYAVQGAEESAAFSLDYVFTDEESANADGSCRIYAGYQADSLAVTEGELLLRNTRTGEEITLKQEDFSGTHFRFLATAEQTGTDRMEILGLTVELADGSRRTVTLAQSGMDPAYVQAGSVCEDQAPRFLAPAAKKDGNVVIVLDPGHDSTHTGARANGLVEESLNLKIAKYCKEELEKYQGVTVYLTREEEACPFPVIDGASSDSNLDNRYRIFFARDHQADAFVSIHLNSAEDSRAQGVEIYYPNDSWKPQIGQTGKDLAASILPKITALGIADRGIKIRNSEDNTRYEDNSIADYYGVINRGKKENVPAIIIEGAFLTNSSDAAFLGQEENLKKLGQADAAGIAAYYGLEKPQLTPVVSDIDQTMGTFTISLSNIPDADQMKSVRFGVFRKDGTYLYWYTAKPDQNGNCSVKADLKNHGLLGGEYYIHVYYDALDGTSAYLCGSGVMMENPVWNYYWGDVDLNGQLQVNDALLVLRHVVRIADIKAGKPIMLADVSQNQSVGVEDAIEILKMIVKLRAPYQYGTVRPDPTPVGMHGQLSVKGTQLTDQSGNAVQLRGISTHGINWFPQYVNREAFQYLRDNWHVNLIRLAMYTYEYNGYCSGGDKTALKNLIYQGVDAAVSLGMYVIVDWHVLNDRNPNTYLADAKQFFQEVTAKYKNTPNVIYEICNEPNSGVSWQEIRNYASQVIPVIRQNAPNAVILVGTPNWSQDVDEAAKNPITGYSNLMYSLHFYSATHKDWLRDKMNTALNQGLPVFVSEFSTCDASGNGGYDFAESEKWLNTLDQKKISYACWSLCNKAESSALLKSSAAGTTAFPDSTLSENGLWIKKWYLKKGLTQ